MKVYFYATVKHFFWIIFSAWIQCFWLEIEGSWLNPFFWFCTEIKCIWKKETKAPVALQVFKSATVNQENKSLLSTNRCVLFFLCDTKAESCSESLSSIFKAWETKSLRNLTFGPLIKKLSPVSLHDFIYTLFI